MKKTEVKEHLESLNAYFTAQIFNGNYTILEICNCTICVQVDNEYCFWFWIGNGLTFFRTYEHRLSTMILTLTDGQKEKLLLEFVSYYENRHKNDPELIAKRKKLFEELKSEFEPEVK